MNAVATLDEIVLNTPHLNTPDILAIVGALKLAGATTAAGALALNGGRGTGAGSWDPQLTALKCGQRAVDLWYSPCELR